MRNVTDDNPPPLVKWSAIGLIVGGIALAFTASRFHRIILARIAISIAGLPLIFLLLMTVANGVSSSNWGAYRRSRQPARFWIDVLILLAGCGLWFAGAWLAPIDRP